MTMLTIKLTQKQAEMLGIVRCANCGYPPNNHFGDGKGGHGVCAYRKDCLIVCAPSARASCHHTPKCRRTAYKQKIVLPKEKDLA